MATIWGLWKIQNKELAAAKKSERQRKHGVWICVWVCDECFLIFLFSFRFFDTFLILFDWIVFSSLFRHWKYNPRWWQTRSYEHKLRWYLLALSEVMTLNGYLKWILFRQATILDWKMSLPCGEKRLIRHQKII